MLAKHREVRNSSLLWTILFLLLTDLWHIHHFLISFTFRSFLSQFVFVRVDIQKKNVRNGVMSRMQPPLCTHHPPLLWPWISITDLGAPQERTPPIPSRKHNAVTPKLPPPQLHNLILVWMPREQRRQVLAASTWRVRTLLNRPPSVGINLLLRSLPPFQWRSIFDQVWDPWWRVSYWHKVVVHHHQWDRCPLIKNVLDRHKERMQRLV